MSAVRDLLAKWRTNTLGDAKLRDVLARGDVPFRVDGLAAASLTLDRAAEMLADALQADILRAEADRLFRHSEAPPPVIAADVEPVDPHEARS